MKEGYDSAGRKYTATRQENLIEMKFLPEFTRYLPDGGKVLDLGCGGGLPFTKYLSERFDVTGVDLSPKQIELARMNVPKGKFICQDMTTLDYPDDTFHGILAYYSIIHVPREEQSELLSNIYRMLKPNGVSLMSLHQFGDVEQVENDFFGATMYWSGWEREVNIKMLRKVGFDLIWEKLVPDSLDGDHEALFVFVKKPI